MYTMIHKNINKTIIYMYISNREQDTMTSEQEWEQVLQIKTTGRDDSRSDAEHHPYEPTDYCVLERLANSGYITKQNTLMITAVARGALAYLWLIRRGAIPSVSNTMNVCMNVLS